MVYDEEIESVNKTNDVSCNTDTFSNLCKNENISFPITKQQMEKTHVSFARESPLKRNEYNPVAQLPVSKTLIIDSPLKLAGLYDCKENRTCEATETVNRNQVIELLFIVIVKVFVDLFIYYNGNVQSFIVNVCSCEYLTLHKFFCLDIIEMCLKR